MRGRMPLGLAAMAALAALLLTLSITLGVNPSGAHADGDDDQAPPKPVLTYPNLSSNLNHLADGYGSGRMSQQQAAGEAPVHSGGSVAVTIHLDSHVSDVVAFLEDNGGDPRNVGEDYIEAYVPVSLLESVSERPGVVRVREIIPPQPAQLTQQVIGNGPAVHGSPAWNQAGYSGQGVKVGIMDNFRGFSALRGIEVPTTAVARCYTDIGVFSSNLADCEAVGQVSTLFPECLDAVQRGAVRSAEHGTIVAESVVDIAPEASLYIANPRSKGDLQNAVDWMVSEGVAVINYSAGWTFDGPGDGTSPLSVSPLNTVDRSVVEDVIWVNSAGNSAQNTWFGGYSDPDGDGAIGFDGGGNVEVNILPLRACRSYRIQLRWEDSWDGASTDLDLYLYDTSTGQYIRSIFSADKQSGESGHEPFETIVFQSGIDSDDLGIVVGHFGGGAPDWIQITVWGDGIQYYTESGSITNPAESANPGLLAVGAAPWYDTDTIESFSSRGPTPDGRVKPDIVGADCGETALRPLNEYRRGFCGTSQASPHVAGMAALVRQRFPDLGPVEVAEYLKGHAIQREAPDPNNTWGHGFAVLPPIVLCSNNPGLEADCAALLAGRDTLAGTGTLNWSANVPVEDWDGVAVGGSPLRVTGLRLPAKGLTGAIPAELGNLASLQVLDLSPNELTGAIPAGLGSLASLQELDLSGNVLTGEIPAELGSLASLEVLRLWGNELTGEIPAELGNLASLQELDLSGNELTGEILAELVGLASLEVLHLWGNQLTGEIPAGLGSLASLQELDLSLNELTGEIPAELGSLASLHELDLSGNGLTGTIPAELGSLASLQQLYLGDNQLSGTIPAQLGGLTNLRELGLTRNQLSGEIPAELAGLTSLEILGLGGNQLTGTIPIWLGILANLEGLYLWGNGLTGTIPAELGSLANLTILELGENQLSGGIPAEFGSLVNLEELRLDNNQLSGEIPVELGRLTNLAVLYLSGNQLTGCVPAGWRDVADNDFSELGLSFCDPGDPLIARYDANNNGMIDRSEVIRAINDYLFGEGEETISRSDVIRLINLYLFG